MRFEIVKDTDDVVAVKPVWDENDPLDRYTQAGFNGNEALIVITKLINNHGESSWTIYKSDDSADGNGLKCMYSVDDNELVGNQIRIMWRKVRTFLTKEGVKGVNGVPLLSM